MSRNFLSQILLPADPASALEAATKQYVDNALGGSHNHDADYVNVTGDTITGDLSFGSSTRQMLNLYSTSYGLGIQSSTLYFRSGAHFSWHEGGAHSNTISDPGTGGVENMRLDSAGRLWLKTGPLRPEAGIETAGGGAQTFYAEAHPTSGVRFRIAANPASGSPMFAFTSSGGADRFVIDHAGTVTVPDNFTVGGAITGSAIFTADPVEIQGGTPYLTLTDINLTGSGRSYFIYQNQGTFYLLMDRTGNGGWNSPHPCSYNGSNWSFSGSGDFTGELTPSGKITTGSSLTTGAAIVCGGNVIQQTGGGAIYWQTPSGGSSSHMYVRTHYRDQALAFVGGDMRSVNYGNSAWKNMAANAFNTPSDSVMKSDMSRFTRAEDIVLAAPVWAYTMHGSTDNRRRLGIMAPDLPEYLTAPDHEWGTEGVDLYNMISILWATVREQGKRLARLEGRTVRDPDVERLKDQIRERLGHDGPVPYAYENLSGEHTRDMSRVHRAIVRQADDRARFKHVPVPRKVRIDPESSAIVGMNPPVKRKR